jgi:hypothetical protein
MSSMQSRFNEWFEQGFDLYKQNFSVLALASLIGGALSLVSMGLLAGPMIAGLIGIVLRLQNGSEPKPEAGDVLKGFEFFLPMILFSLVWGVGLLVVYSILFALPCIGPLLILPVALCAQVLLAFGPFLIVERKLDFWTASLTSIEVVRTHFMDLLGIILVAIVLGGIGGLVCGFGAVITLPLTGCVLARIYRDLFQSRSRAPQPEMVSLDPELG